ncbi:hypothetical protein DES40_0206 [Litorimonas taeanensis]|uniref:Uncharacterized protein n=1 Tax=Litorimonas taeanensis TaxID=568099 RepID=A0A420WJ00_9PROT|nr:hypothetical protein [Litorimonas taeanensis]RKQ70902.1 hypothetical protein DES40_0206 [Litorimonas taeanensis]
MRSQDKVFTFNRTIGFGLLLTLSVQTASGLIWAGAAEARLKAAEIQLSERAPALERLAVMEGQMTMILLSLDRIERQVMANALEAERRP